MSFRDSMDADVLGLFCDTSAGWGTECSIFGHDGKTFTCLACFGDQKRQVVDTGMLRADGSEVDAIICGLRNGEPGGELLGDAWGRDLATDDRVTIASGPDAGTWVVCRSRLTSAHNYDVSLFRESFHSTKMRGSR